MKGFLVALVEWSGVATRPIRDLDALKSQFLKGAIAGSAASS
jgi:hypothetical protein